MARLKSILRLIDATSEWTGKVVSLFIVAVVIVILYEVISRYVFHSPTLWAHEVSRHIYGAHFMLGGAFALRYGHHVITDVVVGRLSARRRAVINSIFWMFFFFYCSLLLVNGVEMARVAFLRQETTLTIFHSPMWPVKFTVPVGAVLILLQGIAIYIRNIYTAATGKELT